MRVVLPAPFGPSSPKTAPSGTSRSTPASACVSPKRFATPSTRIAGPPRPSSADSDRCAGVVFTRRQLPSPKPGRSGHLSQPRLTAVATVQDAAVRHPRDQRPVDRGERIRHRIPGQVQRPPGAVLPDIEAPDGVLARMCRPRARGGRHVPAVRIGRIDRQGPAVAMVTSGVDGLPADAAVAAPSRPVTGGLIGAPLRGWVPGKAVRIALCPGPVVREAPAAVLAVHHAAELDPDEHALGDMRIGGDPADVVSLRPRGKAPPGLRGDLLQRLELGPGTAVPRDEQAARFGPGVKRAVRPADRHGEHIGLGKIDGLPAPTAVQAQSGAVAVGPDQDPLAVRGDAAGRHTLQHRASGPRLAVPVEACHAVDRGSRGRPASESVFTQGWSLRIARRLGIGVPAPGRLFGHSVATADPFPPQNSRQPPRLRCDDAQVVPVGSSPLPRVLLRVLGVRPLGGRL